MHLTTNDKNYLLHTLLLKKIRLNIFYTCFAKKKQASGIFTIHTVMRRKVGNTISISFFLFTLFQHHFLLCEPIRKKMFFFCSSRCYSLESVDQRHSNEKHTHARIVSLKLKNLLQLSFQSSKIISVF